ncbi:hypothetical protein BDZ90DRAFT_234373 [Jaminaea rosea]|uniref:Uncharacterized protein n=1 Tax=Jaminaea rosea TaxID=1569628 RepID=A0A316UIR6_9BASI|nr:hypothetical protein BDZ90DRAFT_234373 [Jaminaea rosea]PWN25172.1 hypothetical protein BDZ90DRAFT_234373 [Jaminaea rosea]
MAPTETMSKFFNFVRQKAGQLDVDDVPRPSICSWSPSTAINAPDGLSRAQWLQAERLLPGALRRAVHKSSDGYWICSFYAASGHGDTTLIAPSPPNETDSWHVLLALDPETSTVRYVYKLRADASPPADDEWAIWDKAVDEYPVTYEARNACRKVVGLRAQTRDRSAVKRNRDEDSDVDQLVNNNFEFHSRGRRVFFLRRSC